MVEITCSESGIVFEAETRRTKQHPAVAQLKAAANKAGTYRQMDKALADVRNAGGYTTIDEFVALVNEQMTGVKTPKQFALEREAEKQAWKDARKAQNELLRANGYKWNMIDVGQDDEFEYGGLDAGKHFFLTDENGVEVSENQALDEIKRGREVVRAEIAARKIAAEQAAKDAKTEQAAKDAEDVAALAEFDENLNDILARVVEVERFDMAGFEVIAQSGVKHGTYRRYDQIRRGEINGVTCYVAITGSGYDDDGYYSYYSVDPDAAKLSKKPATDTGHKYSSFF